MDNKIPITNIRDRVIKEIAVKILCAGVPTFGLSNQNLDIIVSTAAAIYDYKVPEPNRNRVSRPDRGGDLSDKSNS